MNPQNMLAWAPASNPDLVRATAVWISPAQSSPISRETLVSLLADRVQILIDASDDPEDAVAQLVHHLYLGNLLPYEDTVPVPEAGESLVYQNPNVREQLARFGVPLSISDPIVDMPLARECLDDELADPIAGLMGWAYEISRPPRDFLRDPDSPPSIVPSEFGSSVGTPPGSKPHPDQPRNVIFTEAAAERARQALRKKLGIPPPKS